MNKRVIIGEAAGLAWLSADAAWAIGDRWKLDNTGLMTFLFVLALVLGVLFVYLQIHDERLDTERKVAKIEELIEQLTSNGNSVNNSAKEPSAQS